MNPRHPDQIRIANALVPFHLSLAEYRLLGTLYYYESLSPKGLAEVAYEEGRGANWCNLLREELEAALVQACNRRLLAIVTQEDLISQLARMRRERRMGVFGGEEPCIPGNLSCTRHGYSLYRRARTRIFGYLARMWFKRNYPSTDHDCYELYLTPSRKDCLFQIECATQPGYMEGWTDGDSIIRRRKILRARIRRIGFTRFTRFEAYRKAYLLELHYRDDPIPHS